MNNFVLPSVDREGEVVFDGGRVRLNQTTSLEAKTIAGSGRVLFPEDDDRSSLLFRTRSGWVRLGVDLTRDRVDAVGFELPFPVHLDMLKRLYSLTHEPVREEQRGGALLTWEPPGVTFILDPLHDDLVTHLVFHREE